MDSSTAFFEFIFSENPRYFKAAYASLESKPYQIFDILLREERFTNFFSRIEIYGNNLAHLLSQFPSVQKDDYNPSLLQETIRAFTLSFLGERFDDMKSRKATAKIVVSVVKLSHPRILGNFGVRLGALAGILRVLILERHIQELARTHNQCFEDLISEPQAREQWVKFIRDLCKGCEVHRSGPRRTGGAELAKFIRTVPCGSCPSSVSFDCGPSQDHEGENTRSRGHDFGLGSGLSVFKHVLGEPLGPWKIILSQHAIENLGTGGAQDSFEGIRRKLEELASGDWGGKKVLHKAKWDNSLSYRIPLFQASYKTGHFILWQIDTAFDERFEEDYQVIKVWTIGKHRDLGKIAVQIHRTQQLYTKARVRACNRDDLDGSRDIRSPARAFLDGEESSAIGVDDTSDENFDDSVQLAKFYSLTTTVLDNIASTTREVAYPVDISAEEAGAVDHYSPPAFILGRSGTGKTTVLVYKLVGRYLLSRLERREPLRQVLLTKSKRLVEKLRVNTRGLLEAKLGERERRTEGNCSQDDFDDNTRKQFLSLTNADFPLVCTFDYLLRLIENSIREQENRQRYIKINNSKCTGVVDFRRFNIEYWRSLNHRLKSGIPVDSVFLEIMGVIKGSASPATNFEPLSREGYLRRRVKTALSIIPEPKMGAVYDLYEWYERAKKKRGDIDQVDRVLKVMKALEAFKSSGEPEDIAFEEKIRSLLDEIYVDEIQDQRTSDIRMLLSLVGHPWGVHFAGDTAQCISKDALFRFPNAKSLFYERFMDSTWKKEEIKPILLPLSHNFRSHKQILSVASLVMDLLYRGFPTLVDKLSPEIGDIPGPKPVLYVGGDITDILRFEEKMEKPPKSDAQSGGSTEYGEVRVILVRDEETRDKLRTELGTSSLVLTILQSKGMEFDDVLLYDFLSTSVYSHRLGILEDIHKPEYQDDVLCSELKHLYVGVTRARNRLWILESDRYVLQPMQHLFNPTKGHSLLEVLTEQDIGVPELHKRLSKGTTISGSQWREMGHQMIDDQQYSEALRYFERAKDPDGITLTNAYIAEEKGLTSRDRELSEVANLHFIEASELFLQVGSIGKAVQCRKAGGDPKGAVRILADNGAYEDAAWLGAEVGLFSETSEIYTKLHRHEKALAGYARGKQSKWMLDYLKRFRSEIEPCCWKQYIHLYYVMEFGKSDTSLDEFGKRALILTGSLEEQEIAFSRLHLMNKLFDFLSINSRYEEAYEAGISSGLLENSVQLLSGQILLKNPNWGQGEQLNVMCKLLQAEHIEANPWPITGEDGRIYEAPSADSKRDSQQINSFIRRWEVINLALDNFDWYKTSVETGMLSDEEIAGYVDILVTRSAYPNNEFRLPFDHIERVLDDLSKMSSHGTIPPSARLYCGIYETPRQQGEYIALDWSPPSDESKPRLLFKPVDIGLSGDRMLGHILGDLAPSIVSLDEGLRVIWGKSQSTPPPTLRETHFEKVELLARLCRIFSKLSTITKGNRRSKNLLPPNWNWRFWRAALLEKMEFRSSHEQSLEVLFKIKSDFVTQGGRHHALYANLIEKGTTEYRIESAVRMDVGACVSSLLSQYQTSLFLGFKDRWRSAFLDSSRIIDRGDLALKYGSEIITLVHRFLSETEAGDFPGKFCKNIFDILGTLGRRKQALNFYSAPIISLFEELALSLIFLIRPYEFLVPDSWHRLYFDRWERKYRSPSVLERFLYQQCLAKVCLRFCEMVIKIERESAEEIALGPRSATLIVVCLINLGTFFPRPQGYAKLWEKSQEVFGCDRLNNSDIQGLREDELIGRLAKVFREDGRSDSIRLVWGNKGPTNLFSGISLTENGISVVRSHPIAEGKRHLWGASKEETTRQLNAAHILTAFWKLNGPRFLEKMKERRRYLAPRYRYSKNCCLLVDMRGDKNWAY